MRPTDSIIARPCVLTIPRPRRLASTRSNPYRLQLRTFAEIFRTCYSAPMYDYELRYAPLEFRESEDGLGVVTGIVIRYGDVATFPWGTEEFKAGAFGSLDGKVIKANRMHQRSQPLGRTGANLIITDSPEAMRAQLTLPDTASGRDASAELRAGLLTGLSLEYRAVKEVSQGTHRIIETARMGGFGVVDDPAYPGSKVSIRSWGEYREAHGIISHGGHDDRLSQNPDEDERSQGSGERPRRRRLAV